MVRSAHEWSGRAKVLGAVWCVVAAALFHAEFLGPYLICSAIGAMFLLGTRERWQHEGPSAYSVFNKGGKGITGAFTAEQFDAQLRTGNIRAAGAGVSGTVEHEAAAEVQHAKPLNDDERLRRRQAMARAADARAKSQD